MYTQPAMKAGKLICSLAVLSMSLLFSGCAGLTEAAKSDHFVYSNDTSGGGQIFLYDAGSGTSTLIAGNAFVGDLRFDGAKIVFSAFDGTTNQIYTCNPDGSGTVQLTTGASLSTRPLWSHDGSKIVFYSTRDGNAEIYVMNADGSSQTRLTNDAGTDAQASFSFDDSKILWHSNRGGDYEIFTMNSDGTGVTQMTFNAVDDFSAAWLPDDSGFIYSSAATGGGDLYRFNIGTGTSTLVFGSAGSDGFPTVSPNMDKIYFAQRLSGVDRLCSIDFDGSNFQVLVDPADPKSAYINTGTAVVRY